MLEENGGPIAISKFWAQKQLQRLGWGRRKETTGKRQVPTEFASLKEEHLERIKTAVLTYAIPNELVFNWDQTGLAIRPATEWTMAPKGVEKVVVEGAEDKRMITMQVAGFASGELLSPQLIYGGKTDRCHPDADVIPSGWDITHTPSHWANAATTKRFLEKIVVPHLVSTRARLGLADTHKALLIMDLYRGQMEPCTIELIKKYDVEIVMVPGGTDQLQPMDQTVNNRLKKVLKKCYSDWYCEQVVGALHSGKSPENWKMDGR